MVNKEVKRKIIVFILAAAFIANLFISEISNYKSYSFYLKGISTIFLLLVSFIDYKFNKDEKNVLIQIDKKRLAKILLLFLLIPCLSLIYSSNSEFGLIKIVYLLISTLPSSIIFAYLLTTINKKRLDEFLISIISIGILFGLTSLIISPFKRLQQLILLNLQGGAT